MPIRPLTIFIAHPSPMLTDHLPHGDGLIARSFLRQLAAEGHTLHVAWALSDLHEAIPGDVHFHRIDTFFQPSPADQSIGFRLEYAVRVRRLFDQLRRTLAS